MVRKMGAAPRLSQAQWTDDPVLGLMSPSIHGISALCHLLEFCYIPEYNGTMFTVCFQVLDSFGMVRRVVYRCAR